MKKKTEELEKEREEVRKKSEKEHEALSKKLTEEEKTIVDRDQRLTRSLCGGCRHHGPSPAWDYVLCTADNCRGNVVQIKKTTCRHVNLRLPEAAD